MSWRIDEQERAIVLEGFEQGIADSPDHGISNMQNINIASVPGEANVGFATLNVLSYGTISTLGTVTAVASNAFAVTGAAGLTAGMAINFGTISNFTGITGTAVYWVNIAAGTTAFTLSASAARGTVVAVGGTGTANFTVFTPAQPKSFAIAPGSGSHFMVDSNGLVWTDKFLLNGSTGVGAQWVFAGNSVLNQGTSSTSNGITGHLVNDQSAGQGLFLYTGSDNTGWLFVISAKSIDFMQDSSSMPWTYNWNPRTGTTGGSTGLGSADGWLVGQSGGAPQSTTHYSFVAPDGNIYICDAWNVHKIFQTDKITPTAFNPQDGNASTYSYKTFNLLPFGVIAQILAPLGVNILIGGNDRYVYQWDTTSNLITFPIQLPESNIQQIVSVDSNAYIFAGNRGRIYITNGVQAILWKKIPDHISNTVEPYFTWGGAASNKNQLYFSFKLTDNASANLTTAGGLWAVNLETKATRLTNQLSYASYAGFATAILAETGNPNGYGLLIGWDNLNGASNASEFGIDQTTSNPYTNSTSLVDFDNIPIGSQDYPKNFARIEYILTKPLVSGESIQLLYRTDFSQSFTSIVTDTFPNTSGNNYTNSFPLPFSNVKWIQIRAVLNSTTTSPSYVRLKQVRLTGLV